MKSENAVCNVCGCEINEVRYDEFPCKAMIWSNHHDSLYWGQQSCKDAPFVCSAKCNAQAVLNGVLPFKYVMGGIVPGRFISNHFTRLAAWDIPETKELHAKLLTWVSEAPRFGHGLGFVGSVGRGKTCLAIALAHEARKRKASVKYVDCAELNDQLTVLRIGSERQSYTHEEQLKEFNAQFFADKDGLNYRWEDKETRDRKWDLLILDDFTYLDFKNPLVWSLMQRFYNCKQTLIITANGNPKNWQDAGLDQRIVSRLKDMCVFTTFDGDDYRGK